MPKNEVIVRSAAPVLLVGGGEIGPDDLALALEQAGMVVAADGGARAVLARGLVPDAVIGDFDSLDADTRRQIPGDHLFPIREQDSTDFDKALRSVEAPVMLCVGFLGARVDHQLAAFNALARRPERACLLLGAHEIVLLLPPAMGLSLAKGAPVSLFPMRRVSARSSGLEWPIDGLEFEPDGVIGTSNRALGDVRIETDGPGLLAMVPRAALDQIMQGFQSGRFGRWPARAE